jgi:hypothetical protein
MPSQRAFGACSDTSNSWGQANTDFPVSPTPILNHPSQHVMESSRVCTVWASGLPFHPAASNFTYVVFGSRNGHLSERDPIVARFAPSAIHIRGASQHGK